MSTLVPTDESLVIVELDVVMKALGQGNRGTGPRWSAPPDYSTEPSGQEPGLESSDPLAPRASVSEHAVESSSEGIHWPGLGALLPTIGPAAVDSVTAGEVLRDFGVLGKYRTVTSGGKDYVIFKGYPGLRDTLKGTRYGAAHPKVLKMAVGRLGVGASVRAAAQLSVILVVTVEIAGLLGSVLGDKIMLSELGIRLATGLTKAALTALASFVAGAAFVGTGLVFAPIAAGIVVGLAVGIGLEFLDEHLGITDRLQAWAAEWQKSMERKASRNMRIFEYDFLYWLNMQGAGIPWEAFPR